MGSCRFWILPFAFRHDILLHRYNDLDESKRLILETWTENFPDLKAAYWLKERFFNVWQESNCEQAETAYQA
jgi:transposase